MNAFLATIARDLRLATRAGGDILTLILFYVMVAVIVPFAVGPDKILLARLAPGMVWIAAFLSVLLGLDRLFRADHEDGSLVAMRHANVSLETLVLAKIVAHWLTTALPLVLATPMLAVMLNMDLLTFWRTIASLLLGSPGLVAFGAIGAAITVSIKRGGLIAPVLILPLSVPILIFGVSAIAIGPQSETATAARLFLSGLSLVSVAFVPFAAALALKVSAD